MDEAHKSNGIPVVILTSCGSIRVFSRADILQAVQTVTKSHRSSILPCGAEAAVLLFGIRLFGNAASTTGIVSKSIAIPVRGSEQTCYSMVCSGCGKIPLYWIGTSIGWVHVYPEVADVIVRSLPAAA